MVRDIPLQHILALVTLLAITCFASAAFAHGKDERRGLVATADKDGDFLVVDMMMLYEVPPGQRASLLRAQYGMSTKNAPTQASSALLGNTLWPRMSEGFQASYGKRLLKPNERRSHAKPSPKGGLIVATFVSYRVPFQAGSELVLALAPKSAMWPLQVRFQAKSGLDIAKSSHPVVSPEAGIGDLELIPGASLSLALRARSIKE